MVNLDARELGKIIGQGLKQANSYREDFVETEEATDILLANLESIRLSGLWVVSSLIVASDSFVLDHPVKGALDSSVYKLDGGYSSSTLSSSGYL